MPSKKIKTPDSLTEKQKIFCREYIYDWNATRAAKAAGYSEDTARFIASENLTKPNIQAYLTEIQKDLEKTAGLSRLKVLREHEKLAFSSIAHFHDTWITRKEFDQLTSEQKDCISEISTQIKTTRNVDGTLEANEYVKVKLYDKQKALDSISRMLGFDSPEKIEVSGGIKSYKIVPASTRVGTRDSGK